MDRESMTKLQFDKRLAGRRGWIAPADLEKELASLADSAAKARKPNEEDNAAAGGTRESNAGRDD